MPNRRAHDHIGNFNFKVETENAEQGSSQGYAIQLQPQHESDALLSDAAGNYVLSGVGNDTLALEGKLSPTDIWFQRKGDDLIISIEGAAQSLVVADWFTGSRAMIETISTGSYQLDGDKLTEALTLHAEDELVLPELWYQAF